MKWKIEKVVTNTAYWTTTYLCIKLANYTKLKLTSIAYNVIDFSVSDDFFSYNLFLFYSVL